MSQFHFLLMSLSAFFSFTFIFLNSLLSRFFLAKFFTSLFNVIFSTFLCSKLTFLILPFFFLFSSSCLLNYRPLRFLIHFLIFFPAYPFQLNRDICFIFFFFFTISLSYISFSFYTFLNYFPYYLLLLFISLLFLLSSLTFISFSFLFFLFLFYSIIVRYCFFYNYL